MSSELFSQQEIDALFGGGQGAVSATKRTGAVAESDLVVISPRGPVRGRPELYDFRRPHRVARDKLRALEAMHDRMGKALEGWLIGRLRGQVQVTAQTVEQLTFGEFILSLPSPCASYVFDVLDSGGLQGVIDIGLPTAYYAVERFLGGQGNEVTVPERSLTVIERNVVRVVAERIALAVSETWSDQVQLDLAISSFESLPEILQAASREDPVLVANFEVEAGKSKGIIGVCVPFSALEKFFTSQSNQKVKTSVALDRDPSGRVQVASGMVADTPVPVSARLPGFGVPLELVAGLTPGSVIHTGIPVDSAVEVWVAGRSRMTARAARNGQQLALQIIEPMSGSREVADASPAAGDHHGE